MRLEPDAFAHLMRSLSDDAAEAGRRYEELRSRVIRFLAWERSANSEELADEVLDRVALRLYRGEAIQDVMAFAIGVARHVAREEQTRTLRRQSQLAALPMVNPATTAKEGQGDAECFAECFGELPDEARRLLLLYYDQEGRGRIEGRKKLAAELQINLNALRNRALRLREKLEHCLDRCAKRKALSRMMKQPAEDTPGRKESGEGGQPPPQNAMQAYLLDLMPAAEREAMQARLAEDPEFFDALQEAGYGLVDAYAAGRLREDVRRRVQMLAAESPWWARQIAVAAALRQARQPKARGWIARRYWIGAAAAAIAAAAGALRWRRLWQDQKPEQTAPEELAAATLVAGVFRAGQPPQTVTLEARHTALRLTLEAEGAAAGEAVQIQVRISGGSGAPVWEQTGGRVTGGDRIEATIPAALLPPGLYRLEAQTRERAYEYIFRVERITGQ